MKFKSNGSVEFNRIYLIEEFDARANRLRLIRVEPMKQIKIVLYVQCQVAISSIQNFVSSRKDPVQVCRSLKLNLNSYEENYDKFR